jgi:hypothetical protein
MVSSDATALLYPVFLQKRGALEQMRSLLLNNITLPW